MATFVYVDQEYNLRYQVVLFSSLGVDIRGNTPDDEYSDAALPDVFIDNSRGLNKNSRDITAHEMYVPLVTATGFVVKAKNLNKSAVRNLHNIRVIER